MKHPPGKCVIGVERIIGHERFGVGNRGGLVELNHNEGVTIPIGVGAGTNKFAFFFQFSKKLRWAGRSSMICELSAG